MLCLQLFNPLPNDKILDLSKLKAFADDKLNVTKNFNRVKEAAFFLFLQCFQKAFFFRGIKSRDCCKELNISHIKRLTSTYQMLMPTNDPIFH